MSPIQIWGPRTWTFFHTLIEKINPDFFQQIAPQLFLFFTRICRLLPCPECATDAIKFLGKLNPSNYSSKMEFKNTFYLFHNYVNVKKRKPLFNYANINMYQNYKLNHVLQNFFVAYNTKGNMQLISESFQRELLVKEFKKWFFGSLSGFQIKYKIDPPLKEIESPPTNV